MLIKFSDHFSSNKIYEGEYKEIPHTDKIHFVVIPTENKYRLFVIGETHVKDENYDKDVKKIFNLSSGEFNNYDELVEHLQHYTDFINIEKFINKLKDNEKHKKEFHYISVFNKHLLNPLLLHVGKGNEMTIPSFTNK